MDPIQLQAKRARRRLTSQIFLGTLPWCLVSYLAAAALAIAVPRLLYVGLEPQVWYWGWIGSAVALAFINTALITWLHRPTLLKSAIEVDRRFGLRERVSSAMSLSEEDRQTELGKALLSDAATKADRLDIRDQFLVGFSRKLLIPVLPIAALAAMWFVPLVTAPEVVAENGSKAPLIKQVKNATNPLLEQIKKKRELAEEKGLEEAADLFKRLESELEEMQKKGTLDRKEALSKLNEIKQEIEKRKKEVGTGSELQKNMEKLKDLNDGPAEKVAKAMEGGDFDKAKEELENLLDQMKSGEISQEQQQKLAEQLKQMEKALEKSASEQEQKKKDLEQKMKAAEESGDSQQAGQMAKELAEMESAAAQMQQMKNMANQLAKAQKAMESGDKQQAEKELQELADQLGDLQEAAEEMENLDEMLDELSESKDQMNCEKCDGEGCDKCKDGNKPGKGKGKGKGKGQSDSMGDGLGEGNGEGDRPEEESDTDTFDSQLRDKMREGETIVAGKIGGANKKGVSREQVKEAILSSAVEDADALESENLPRLQRDHTREYFNAIREGKEKK